ncbi:SUMF1/EgtB/PvdO family nonheme iron enzyme, partial [bacterium]|nr:SUMF1/EgtB/PvdO family nonheme iron enzyme [bacterium]
MEAEPRDYYDILGIAHDATHEEVRAAFRHEVKRWHPDLHPEHGKSGEALLRAVEDAWKALGDPARRRAYDRSLRRHRSRRSGRIHGRRDSSSRGTSTRRQDTYEGTREDMWLSVTLKAMVLGLLAIAVSLAVVHFWGSIGEPLRTRTRPARRPRDSKTGSAPRATRVLHALVQAAFERGDETVVNSVGMLLRRVTPGESDHVAKPYYLAVYETTQGEYERVMGKGTNPSRFSDSPDRPVESLYYRDAEAFCYRLSAAEGVRYHLPTVEQWEYACRAGSEAVYSSAELLVYAWFDGNSGRRTHLVGQKRANAFGFHDMYGNVWELCEGTLRRGGSFLTAGHLCQRAGSQFFGASESIGFRVAVSPPAKRPETTVAAVQLPQPLDEPTPQERGDPVVPPPRVRLWQPLFKMLEFVSDAAVSKLAAGSRAVASALLRRRETTTAAVQPSQRSAATVTAAHPPQPPDEPTPQERDRPVAVAPRGPLRPRETPAEVARAPRRAVVVRLVADDPEDPKYDGGRWQTPPKTVDDLDHPLPKEHLWQPSSEMVEAARAAVRGRKANVTNSLGMRLRLIHSASPVRFYISVYETTQGQYETVMGSDANRSFARGNLQRPVENVTFEEAQQFCLRLSRVEGLLYCLPSEEQWKLVCASVVDIHGKRLSERAWHKANSRGITHPVGLKRPNAFGLYDMLG